ncbi:hypothetical protein PsAD46_05589 [Pseudovibrio sp. Ad46]|uniref:hypothetical protein n=1 Tax=Pseudovibrio sp. Ad46 TaxID=989432 RepID=UPI0007AE9C67|nr:hypothetical protein [Pseudovibrio sp. Ad46]KZK75681.1 hypothetical protein PsAD46_05589 [Pseudovibrio sp. Ad46]
MKKVILGLAIAACATPVLADEVTLNNTQITELLTGSTIKGIHFAAETRQYFSESGLTLWIKEGDAKPSEARYKIENNQYCSSWTGLWSKEEYGCFNITHDKEQGIYYFINEDFRAPFILNNKFQLTFD